MVIDFQHRSQRAMAKLSTLHDCCSDPTTKTHIAVANPFGFLTFTGGNLVTPCTVLQTFDLERVHYLTILKRNPEGNEKKEGVD